MQTEDIDGFSHALEVAAWSAWSLDIAAKPREYKGETRMRVNVRAARPLCWAADSQRLLQLLSGTA